MSVIGSNILAGASGQGGGYFLTNSLRFRSSASAYLNRTPASAGNRQKWTWSGWVKLGLLNPSSGWNAIFGAYSDDNNRTFFYTNNNSVSNTFYIFDIAGGSTTCTLISTQVLRDVSAWYHLIVSVDTTQATSSDRIKVYLNGNQITSFGTASYPSQNTNFMVNNNVVHYIGASSFSGINLFHDGYLTEVNFIDGQALTPSSFGETSATTGVWIPKKYTGTYGTNGFYLPFTDNSALTTSSNAGLGKDFSGNSNYWTTNNISITSGSTYDSMTDVPTLTSATAANFATLNPVAAGDYFASGQTSITLTGANLNYGTGGRNAFGTIAVSSGKYYWEMSNTSNTASAVPLFGLVTVAARASVYGVYYQPNGNKGLGTLNSGATETAYGATWTDNDVIGVALDMDAATPTVTYYKNNTSQGAISVSSFVGQSVMLWIQNGANSGNMAGWVNFGQRPFAYTPPTGFVALNTFNLPTPTIGATASTTANKYFDALTWTGDGASPKSRTGYSFAPDLVWTKGRSQSTDNALFDRVRGTGSKVLESNLTDAENNYGLTVDSFDANGFTTSNGSFNHSYANTNGTTYVGWAWKANGSGSTNTAGTITSTVSANTTAGFSIVTYSITSASSTISTFGHGLGVAPNMVILKVRNAVDEWTVYHSSISTPNSNWLTLNTTNAAGGATSTFSSSSTTFGVRETRLVGSGSSGNVLAYCFAQVAGYSAFGSYTGNGSSDGTYIHLGFSPKYVMIKRTDSTEDWIVMDTARNTYNVANSSLFPNGSYSETTDSNRQIDFLSNGFKIRSSGVWLNASGGNFIYMAFASVPAKFSLGR